MKNILLSFFFIFTSSFTQHSKLFLKIDSLSKYIASEEFLTLKKTIGELSAIDSIFSLSNRINDYDLSESLLTLTFATIPYKKVPIIIPFTKSKIFYPIISSEDSIFNKKNKNLPRKFFLDSPNFEDGDKDKLAHFFGSAFLSYTAKLFDITELIGYFIEVIENSLVEKAKADTRDMNTNKLGKFFGKKLIFDKNILPSHILKNKSLKNYK